MNINPHILLIEDDPTLQELIEKLLVTNNYLVSKAGKISEAEKLIKLFTFDLILLDIMLPDSNGLDFYVNNIKNRINSPVIFLSALSNADDRVTGLELGAEDYIGKPFDSRELLLKIKKNLSKKNLDKSIKKISERIMVLFKKTDSKYMSGFINVIENL